MRLVVDKWGKLDADVSGSIGEARNIRSSLVSPKGPVSAAHQPFNANVLQF